MEPDSLHSPKKEKPRRRREWLILLLALLMSFNTFGGLVVVPAFVKVLRPGFLVRRRPRHLGAAHVAVP